MRPHSTTRGRFASVMGSDHSTRAWRARAASASGPGHNPRDRCGRRSVALLAHPGRIHWRLTRPSREGSDRSHHATAEGRANMRVSAATIESQLVSVFRAWGMSDQHAATTASLMVETDLRGVDSHGISMLPTYDKEFRAGRLNMRPQFKVVREGPATALIDADASLGHPVSVHAMNMAVDKCREIGVAVVSVFNSHHFGAAGCYSRIAADRGAIGMVTSATRGVSMVPTFASEPVMGTNPLAFAAPARRNPPFQLDMATTTVAAGKVKVYKLNHKPLPSGWVVDGDGKTVTDPAKGLQHVTDHDGGITPLGGS